MRTLRGRITVTTVLIAAVGLAVGAWGFARATEHALLDQLDRDLNAEALAIAERAGAGASPGTLATAAQATRLVQIRRSDGTVLAASRHRIRQSADLEELEIEADPRASPSGSGWRTGRSDLNGLGAGWHTAGAASRGPSGGFDAVIAAPLADLERTVTTVRGVAYASVPVLVGVIGVLVWFALGRLLQPVEGLRRQAAAAADVYPPPRLAATTGGAEIEALMGTLDALLQRSAAGVRRQRRFLANASHELLSPLTVLRTVLEVAQRRGDPSDTPAVLERSLASQARLEQIAQQLLSLARAEEVDRIDLTDVDLAGLVREVTDELAPVAAVPVVTQLPGTLRIDGDRAGLYQLVDNLVRNAVRHASAGVDVRLHAGSDSVVLDVDDDGPGIPGEHRRTVFEPFVRVDEARGRRQGGAGLGLAIARAVALRHGGGVTVSESPRGGARLRVVLPRRAAAVTSDSAPPAGRALRTAATGWWPARGSWSAAFRRGRERCPARTRPSRAGTGRTPPPRRWSRSRGR
jgi:signal transduction histidine kinase